MTSKGYSILFHHEGELALPDNKTPSIENFCKQKHDQMLSSLNDDLQSLQMRFYHDEARYCCEKEFDFVFREGVVNTEESSLPKMVERDVVLLNTFAKWIIQRVCTKEGKNSDVTFKHRIIRKGNSLVDQEYFYIVNIEKSIKKT